MMGGRSNKNGPWPECVGKSGDECRELILAADPDVTVQILSKDSMMTMDFRTDRVRILVDDDGIVAITPSRG